MALGPATDVEPATPEAGTIPGTFAVTSTGEATYTMPLVSPPGRAGIEPSLALAYASSSGDGILGMGFQLAGLSSIARCPSNVAQDGFIRAVRDDGSDKLCLDGKRLVEVGFSNGATEYRTLPDTFLKVLAYDGAGWDAARGHEWFEVYERSGRITVYGGSVDSRVLGKGKIVRAWAVARSRDRRGNYVAYTYDNDLDATTGATLEHVPLRIDYTGHPDRKPSRAVSFVYEPRAPSDVRVSFAAGAATRSSRRIAAIDMLGPKDALVREYAFAYGLGPATGRTLLASVRECAPDGGCKPPTQLTYTGNEPGFEAKYTAVRAPTSVKASPMLLDVTGDGLPDLVMPDASPASTLATANAGDGDSTQGALDVVTDWTVFRNRGPTAAPVFASGIDALWEDSPPEVPVPPGLDVFTVQPEVGTAIDYDQDGRADVFLHDVWQAHPHWLLLLSRPGGAFVYGNTGIPSAAFDPPPKVPSLSSPNASVHLADVDGDGVPDLIQCDTDDSANPNPVGNMTTWTLHRWKPKDGARPIGWDPVGEEIPRLRGRPCNAELYTVDVDADGKVDLVMVKVAADNGGNMFLLDQYEALSWNESGWEQRDLGLTTAMPGARVIFLDVNGDGLPDALEVLEDDQIRTFVNTGDGFASPVNSLSAPLPGGALGFWSLAAPIDWNGDGRQDLLFLEPLGGEGGAPAWVVLQSTGRVGDGTFTIVDPGLPFQPALQGPDVTSADPNGPRVADVDGDGADDVVMLTLSGRYSVFRSRAADQDLLATVTDGLNAHDPGDPAFVPDVSISYDHFADRSITDGVAKGKEREKYTYLSRHDPSNGCDYPRSCVVGPRRVVSAYELNDGADRERRFKLHYRDGRWHRLGRGFLGFGSRLLVDEDTGAGTEEVYDNVTYDPTSRTFPFAGQLVHARSYSPALPGQPDEDQIEVSVVDVGLAIVPTSEGKTYFTLPISRRTRWEEGVFPVHDKPSLTALEYADGAEALGAKVLSDTRYTVSKYDAFGNVQEASTTTAGVDLTSRVSRTFSNDTTTWLIGLPTTESVCSEAMSIRQCRTVSRDFDAYGQVRAEAIGSDDQSPETELSTQLWRDAFGNVTAVVSTDGFGGSRSSCTTYEPEGIFPWARGDALGHVSYLAFDPGLGVPLTATDPNGLVTRWAYDGLGREARETRPDGTSTTLTLARTERHGAYEVTRRTRTTGGADETVVLDERGRVVRRLWYGTALPSTPPPARVMERIVFDPLGEHVERRSLPAPEGTPDAQLHDDVFDYDATGRVARHTTPWGLVTRYTYEGAVSKVTIGSAAPAIVAHDALGRPAEVTDAAGGTTKYQYGPFGATWSVEAPDHTKTLTRHDAYGRVTLREDPDTGATVSHYNGFGELTSSTDANGRVVGFVHDALGRMTERSDTDPTGASATTTWTWDTAPLGSTGSPALGRLAGVSSPGGEKTYTYDDVARPRSTTLAVTGDPASDAMTVTLGYDPLGRLSTVAYPPSAAGAFAVENGYDAYGHLIEVDDAATGATFWKISGLDPVGRIQTESFGNGAVTTRGYYDDEQRLATLKTTAAPGTVQDLEYAYDPRLNLLSRVDWRQGAREQFRYDALDRLTCSYFGPADPHAPCLHSWKFDASGNIQEKDGTAYHYDDPAHAHAVTSVGTGSGASTYGYDDVGDQIMRNGATVTYTPFDLPSVLSTSQGDVTLDYDGDQQRIRKSDPSGDVTEYFGDLYERIEHADGTKGHVYYVHGAERAVAVVTAEDAFGTNFGPPVRTYYLHVDHLGSIDAITDEKGHVVERRSYEPFGERRNFLWGQPPPASFPSATTLGFTGHEADDELGLVNMKGRVYDPKLGRFLTPDPIVSRPFNGQSRNPYSYVVNNPLAFVDPSGFEPQGQGAEGVPSVSPVELYACIGPKCDDPPPKNDEDPSRYPPNVGDARDAGVVRPPNDVGTTGDTSGPGTGAQNGGELTPGQVYARTLLVDYLAAFPGQTLNLFTVGGYGGAMWGREIGTALASDGVGGAMDAVLRGLPVIGPTLALRDIYWGHDWDLESPESQAEALAHATPLVAGLLVDVALLTNLVGGGGEACPDCANGVCFVAGTGVLTPMGVLAIESLRPGDLVVTWDAGAVASSWGAAAAACVEGPDAEPSDRAFDGTARAPALDDVVWVVAETSAPDAHARLADVRAGARVAFQGKVYETRRREEQIEIRATGEVLERVRQASRRGTDGLVELTVRTTQGEHRVVGTPEHPFYVPELRGFVRMGDLAPGMGLLGAGRQPAEVVALGPRTASSEVFNVEVERTHTYFVCGGVESGCELVHNTCPADVLMPGGVKVGQAGASSSIRVVTGGVTEAQTMFAELSKGGTVVTGGGYPGTLVRLNGGGTVGLRTVATGTGVRAAPAATIDVNITGIGIREVKFVP
jgi:RHS repeat-associated protein